MIKKAKNLLQTDLIKVFSLTGLSTVIKLLTSYITVKVVAALVGPGGIALIGQLQNFTAIFTTLGSGGINNGVIRYVSEYKSDEPSLKKWKKSSCLGLSRVTLSESRKTVGGRSRKTHALAF